MLVKRPFLKLPIRFDAEAISAEIRALPSSAWVPHPTGFVGNEAVRLVSPGGEETDSTDGQMAATPHLQNCQYIREVMEEIGSVWGRSRLMGLAAGRQVPPHIDTHYYWRTHFRIHIPVITNPGVSFTCGDETVHMEAGDCWIFDSFRLHDVQNRGFAQRIHLVLDTVGGGQLPALIDAAMGGSAEPRLVKPGERSGSKLMFEKMNSPTVMSPWEVRCHLAFLAEKTKPHPRLAPVLHRVDEFSDSWAAAWAAYGTDDAGRPMYEKLLRGVRTDLAALGGQEISLSNDTLLYHMLEKLVFSIALAAPETPALRSAEAVARAG